MCVCVCPVQTSAYDNIQDISDLVFVATNFRLHSDCDDEDVDDDDEGNGSIIWLSTERGAPDVFLTLSETQRILWQRNELAAERQMWRAQDNGDGGALSRV